jgi:hypothetical protein
MQTNLGLTGEHFFEAWNAELLQGTQTNFLKSIYFSLLPTSFFFNHTIDSEGLRRKGESTIMASREKIRELLGLGLPNNVVAQAVGVTEGYISQLLAEEDFRREVHNLRLQNLTELSERDKKWNTLEDQLLQKLEDLLPFGFVKPMEVLKALQIINGAKRRAMNMEVPAQAPQQLVPLVLPTVFAPKFVLNGDNQVIEVDGRTIATISAKAVNEKLANPDPAAINQKLIQEDENRALQRLDRLKKLETLPVHELL